MRRIRSTFRFALPFTLLLSATAVVTIMPTPTLAEYQPIDSWTTSNGSTVTYWSDDKTGKTMLSIDTGSKFYMLWSEKLIQAFISRGNKSDPGPDEPTQRIDKPDVANAIKKGLITYTVKANPENTPLVKWIERDGGGLASVYHPTDDDNQSRPGLPKVKNTEGGLTDQQKAEITRLVNYAAKSLGELGASMGGEFDALGGESAPTPNKSGSSGRSKGTGTGKGSKNTGVYVPRDIDTLGPRPDLVNPPHGKSGASGAMSPGLLDGGSSFSTNGPSGAGTAIGKGGGTTSHGAGAAGIR